VASEIVRLVGLNCEWCEKMVLYDEAESCDECGVYLCDECAEGHECELCVECRVFHEVGNCPEEVGG